MYALKGVDLAYEGKTVLADICLAIAPGEKVALIGPSGAGKTTLLKELYTRAEAAFIHQDLALVPQLSVFHNICAGRLDQQTTWHNLVNLLKPRASDVAAVRTLLDRLGMAEHLFNSVAMLSGGQMQRVAVARALYRGGAVLLADEPVAAVDPARAGLVLDLLRDGAQTVVVSLHDVALALAHFDRILGLRDGGIAFDLPVAEIDQGMLEALYRPC
ncbi:ATP-binding cassette domain-containing protein [Candidatus Latescibacteria bacterium]|jgi:phosphonate transport system ATP-binding protein|nr:ATP-binding cassette domain-containing protein [Candidatus Latescibacterota bacterium]